MSGLNVRPPWWHPSWRAWLYGVAWLGGGVTLTVMSIWMVRLIVNGDWTPGSEAQRLNILATALYMTLSGPLLVMLGLALRNAIRNVKIGGPAGSSFEATSHRGGEE